MSSSTAISIILPAKNAEQTIRRALESMLGQTWTDFELILIDDASTDRTKAIAAEFARADRRVRVLDARSPGGLVAALQTGTDAATGPFLARMDADDVSHPDRLQKQIGWMDANPGVAACGCRVRVPEALGDGIERYITWSNDLTAPEDIERERFIESPLVHPSVVMRTEAFRSVGGYRDPGWAEDYDLWLRMLDAGMKIGKHTDVLLDWHDHPKRLTRSDSRYANDQFLRAKAHFLNRLPSAKIRGFALCGAGPTGKRLGRFLKNEGATVHNYYEVHPRRVGEQIGGIPVKHNGEIPPANSTGKGLSPLLISAVGTQITRARVLDYLQNLGYQNGIDFFAAA